MSLDHGTVSDLLGAYALDACSPEESEAIERHVEGCAACATEAARLSDAAGWLGALEGAAPPAELLDAILAAVRAPEEEATPPEVYLAQVEGLLDVLDELPGEAWGRAAADDWTVQDLVAHLTATDSLLAETIGAASVAEPLDPDDVFGRTSAFVERNRERDPFATRTAWWDQATEVHRRVVGLGPAGLDEPVPWLGVTMPLRRVVLARAFEIWIHTEDIRKAAGLGSQPPEPAHVHLVAGLAVRSLPAALRSLGRPHPGRTVRVVLTGPGGGAWSLPLDRGAEAGEPNAVLTADVLDFCLLAGGRLRPHELAHTVEGDAGLGADLIAAAPAFAGP